MPAPIIFERGKGLNSAILGVGDSFAQAINKRGEEQKKLAKQKKNQGILTNAMEGLNESSSPIEIVSSLQRGLAQGLDLDYAKTAFGIYEPFIKEGLQQEKQRGILEQLGLGPNQGSNPMQNNMQPNMQNAPQNPMQPNMQGAQNQGMQNPQMGQQNVLQNLSDQQLVALQGSGIPQAKDAATAEMKRRSGQDKNFRQDRDFAYKRAGKFFDKLEEQSDRLQDQAEALDLMEGAVTEGDLKFFSQDNFAEFLGKYGEGLRTAKGAQLKTAQKEFLVSDLGRVGNRPNQWIEQQISQALTRIGRSKEANLTVIEGLRARLERGQAKQEISRNLEDFYLNKDGTIPANFTNIVSETLKPIQKNISDKLAYKLRMIHERENKGDIEQIIRKKPPRGTSMTLPMMVSFIKKSGGDPNKARKVAKKLGYTMLSEEQYKKYDPENYDLLIKNN